MSHISAPHGDVRGYFLRPVRPLGVGYMYSYLFLTYFLISNCGYHGQVPEP